MMEIFSGFLFVVSVVSTLFPFLLISLFIKEQTQKTLPEAVFTMFFWVLAVIGLLTILYLTGKAIS